MRRWTPLVALVAIDQLTKLAAAHWLPADQALDPSAAFQLVLRRNATGLGSWALALGARSRLDALASAGIAIAIASAVIVELRQRRARPMRVAGSAIAAYFATTLLALAAIRALGGVPLRVASVLGSAGGTIFLVTLRTLSRSRLAVAATTLLSACGIGNLLSQLMPPFEVIDFVWSRHLARLAGIGVFNFADACSDLGLLVALAWLVARVVAAARGRPWPPR